MRLVAPEDFEPWVGRKVRLSTVPAPVEITLARIERTATRGNPFREPFSLFFEAPFDIYLLDNRYTMDCGRGGPYDIFIAQLAPIGNTRQYQASFA